VPADEGLRESDLLDQIRDGGVTARETSDDPKPIDVGEGLVDDPQLAQVLGLVDDRRERGPNPGA
jgi:hypothetical protein